MKRPKNPDDPKDKPGEDKSPPGGRARERVDLFNRQRGLPTESGEESGKDDADEAPDTPPKNKTK